MNIGKKGRKKRDDGEYISGASRNGVAAEFSESLVGRELSHVWRGYGSALFLMLASGVAMGGYSVPERPYEPCGTVSTCIDSVRNAIAINWHVPEGTSRGVIVIEISLGDDFEVLESRIIESSGGPAHDRRALKAVGWAGPFKALSGLPDSYFRQNFVLRFDPDNL